MKRQHHGSATRTIETSTTPRCFRGMTQRAGHRWRRTVGYMFFATPENFGMSRRTLPEPLSEKKGTERKRNSAGRAVQLHNAFGVTRTDRRPSACNVRGKQNSSTPQSMGGRSSAHTKWRRVLQEADLLGNFRGCCRRRKDEKASKVALATDHDRSRSHLGSSLKMHLQKGGAGHGRKAREASAPAGVASRTPRGGVQLALQQKQSKPVIHVLFNILRVPFKKKRKSPENSSLIKGGKPSGPPTGIS